tara:strand:- start:457 stop:693 length:237 start_codon:yes stop_codon:yes gene_type:complete
MTAINTTFDDNFMLSELKQSVGETGRGFVVIYKQNPKYVDSISELRDWLQKNGLYIHSFDNYNNVIHYVFVRSERGGD